MKKIKIIHWDDDKIERGFSEITIVKYLKELSVEVEKNIFFEDCDQFFKALSTDNFGLIIIDLHQKKDKKHPEAIEKQGFAILNNIIRDFNNKFTILVYTKYDNCIDEVISYQSKFNLNIEMLSKNLKYTPNYIPELKKCLTNLLDLKPLQMKFTANKDILTTHTISTIGQENLATLIGSYIKNRTDKNMPKVIEKVKAIAPGYSGAFVLLVKFKTFSKLFKITNNYSQIVKEYNNLANYNSQLRSVFKTDYERIHPDDISKNGWYSIVYEYVPHSKTFFSWLSEINNNQMKSNIVDVLSSLFSEDGILQLQIPQEEKKGTVIDNILIDIDPSRIAYINSSYSDLRVILKDPKYNKILDKEHLLDILLESHTFGSIKNSNLSEPVSSIYLCHNDLHANNILLDRMNNPILIDPGNMKPKHWSSDICRLMVDLITRGLDINNIEYFKLATIDKWLPQIVSIIKGEPEIEIFQNDTNTGFKIAINWLRFNVDKIYSVFYDKWEFQLGLSVEFLKASYKSVSLPPGKRALAILAACEAVRIANESLKAELKNKN